MQTGAAPSVGIAVAGPSPLAFRVARWIALLLTASLPTLLAVYLVTPEAPAVYGWDFRAFYDAGRAYLEHRPPYPEPTLAAMTSQNNFVYPLPAAAVFVPWALLPLPLAIALFAAGSAACLGLALRLLGVRDWRCYGIAFLSLPAQMAVELGTVMPALTLLLAVLWRHRDRRALAVPALAVLATAKLFLWPLGVWALATRRAVTALAAAALAAGAVVLAALPFGLGVYRDYPRLLQLLSFFEAPLGYSPLGLGLALGLSRAAATAAVCVVGLALLAAVVATGVRGRDLLSFRLALAASFALTPIVWSHYFVLLLVPLALLRPRFSPLWLALAWAPGTLQMVSHGRTVLVGGALALAAAQLGLAGGWRPPRVALGGSLAFAAATVATVAASAAAMPRVDRPAALEPVAPGRDASGTAILRFDVGRGTVCWRVWTEAVPRPATGRLAGADASVPIGDLRLNRDGAGEGCAAPSGGGARRLFANVKERPERFRLVVSAGDPARPLLAGPLADALHPAGER